MKTIITFFLFVAIAQGETIVTYDSRFGQTPPVSQLRTIDIGDTSALTNPEFNELNKRVSLRSVSAPALLDVQSGIGVAITGTMEQARVDLLRVEDALPATPERTLLQKLTKRLLKDGELTKEEAQLVAALFPPLVEGKAYKSNDLVRTEGGLVAIAEDFTPDKPGKPSKPISTKPIFEDQKKTK